MRVIFSETRVWIAIAIGVLLLICMPLLAILSEIRFAVFDEFLRSLTASYTLNTIVLLVGVSLLALVFGVGPAWLVAGFKFPLSNFFGWSLVLPLAIPAYILAFIYKGMLGLYGTSHAITGHFFEIDNIWSLIFILAISLYPYIYLSARASFQQHGAYFGNAASSLGANNRMIFLKILLPLSWPAIFAGLILVIMEVLNNYGAVKYYGVNTFTTEIVRNWNPMDKGAVHNIAALLLLIVIVIFILESRLRSRAKFTDRSAGFAEGKKQALHGYKAVLAFLFCLFPVTFGFLLPMLQLVYWAIDKWDILREPEMFQTIGTTFGVGLTGAGICVLIAFIIRFLLHHFKSKVLQSLDRLASLGYAVPGALLGVGMLSVLFWLMSWTGINLTTSLSFLIFAYVIRFYAVANGTVQAGFEKISTNIGFNAFSLGASLSSTMNRIHFPLLRSTLLVAAILVFVDVIKELPLTMMFQRFNFSTLAVEAFTLMETDGAIYDASLPSLLIVLISIIPVVLVNRLIK